MKTHVTINGKEIKLIQEDIVYSMGNPAVAMPLNEDQHKINELLLALDGLSFEKKEEQKPFSVDNPPYEEDIFWSVDNSLGRFTVRRGYFETEMQEDNNRIIDNNCFRTKEEAEAALSRVLQALKS